MLALPSNRGATPALAGNDEKYPVPPISLRHMQRLTNEDGIHEFAQGTEPNRENGHCAEDVARALVAVTLHEQVTGRTDARPLAAIYISSLRKNLRPDGQLWNRAGRMLTQGDSYGRVLWGLGYAASFHPTPEVADPARDLFERILPGYDKKLGPHPIARACALQGLASFWRRHPLPTVRTALMACAEANVALYHDFKNEKWRWFGATMTYDCGRLPLALLLAFQATGAVQYREVALDSLDFLLTTCFDAGGIRFSPVGNRGWFKQGGAPARYDQQPIDAAAMVEACAAAWQVTGDAKYARRARKAFEWFLGNNLGQVELYDPVSGGCRDGLGEKGANRNQGGESTIMYLIARCSLETLVHPLRHE